MDLGRNELCHCGSGLKYKKCCLRHDEMINFAGQFVNQLVDAVKDVDAGDIEAFHIKFPKEAEAENRAIWALGRTPFKDEPFQLVEFYCTDPKCDCNRVIIGAVDLESPDEGTIVSVGYAFDRNDPDPGPYLDPLNPATNNGRKLYPLIAEMLEKDQSYVERLKRHYEMVKDRVKSETLTRPSVIPRHYLLSATNLHQDQVARAILNSQRHVH